MTEQPPVTRLEDLAVIFSQPVNSSPRVEIVDRRRAVELVSLTLAEGVTLASWLAAHSVPPGDPGS